MTRTLLFFLAFVAAGSTIAQPVYPLNADEPCGSGTTNCQEVIDFWNAAGWSGLIDFDGTSLASGIYSIRFDSEGNSEVRRMSVVR